MKKRRFLLLIGIGVLVVTGVIAALLLRRQSYFAPMDGPGMVYEVVVDEIEYVETNHITGGTYRLTARRDGSVHLTLERRTAGEAAPIILEAEAGESLLAEIGDAIRKGGLEKAGSYPERDPYRMPDVTSWLKVTEPYRTFTVTSLMELSELEQSGWDEVVSLMEAALNEPTYPVSYWTDMEYLENAKATYPAGASVVIYYDRIATDTNYAFLLDGEPLNCDFDESKGFVISFFMPAHEVKLECEMKNSMMYNPEAHMASLEEETEMIMRINDTIVLVSWEDNESVAALRKLVAENGELVVPMSMYGGFEQVGSLGSTLPRADVQTRTQAGDIVLYAGDQIVVFYGSNSWAYTRLGRITDQTDGQMRALLSNGNVTITIAFQ